MKSYRDITLKYLKTQKKRTILTIVGIMLSVALITAIGTMLVSYRDMQIKETIKNSGDYHVKFINVNKDNVIKIKDNKDVKASGVTFYEGDTIISENSSQDNTKDYKDKVLSIFNYDKEAFTMLSTQVEEGRLPEKPGEIIIDKWAQEYIKGNPKIGDKIKFKIGDRTDKNSSKIRGFGEFGDDDIFKEREEKEYTIVGFIKEPFYYSNSKFGKTIAYFDNEIKNEDKKYNVYVKMNSIKNTQEKANRIAQNLNIDSKTIQYNNRLLTLSAQGINKNINKSLVLILLFIMSIIIVSTIAVIYNAFNISVIERKSQFGILRCTGASPNQIKSIVLREAFILSIIAIPIGLICGVFAMKIVMLIIGTMKFKLFGDLKVVTSYYVFAVSSIIGLITVYLSALGPARSAAKVSPLEAVRSAGSFKVENFKKVKKSLTAKFLFGIEGNLAYKNLRRNRKRFRITVFSMIISIVLYIVFSCFVNFAFKTGMNDVKETGDFSVFGNYEKGVSKDILKEIKSLSGIDKVYEIMSDNCTADIPLDKLNDKFVKETKIENQYITHQGINNCQLTSYGEEGLKEIKNYLVSGSADIETLDKNDGVVLMNIAKLYNDKEKKIKYIPVTNYKIGDTIKIEAYGINKGEKEIQYKTVKIVGIAEKGPFNTYNENRGINFVTSENVFKNIEGNDKINNIVIMMKKGEDRTKVSKYLEEMNKKDKSYQYVDYLQSAKEGRDAVVTVSIFLYGFIGVIALIGCLNIINTISTNLILRTREFSVLKAVGMTGSGIRKMVLLESIFYGLIASIYGSVIGTGLAYILFKLFIPVREFTWVFPLKSIIIAVIGATLVALVSGIVPLKRINEGNIIDNIRMEE